MEPNHPSQLPRLLRRPDVLGQEAKLLCHAPHQLFICTSTPNRTPTPTPTAVPPPVPLHQAPRALDVRPDGLLAQYVLAGAEGRLDGGRLRGDGQRDEHGGDVGAREEGCVGFVGGVFGVEVDGRVGSGEESEGGLRRGKGAGVDCFED